MPVQFLATKLYVPPLRAEFVPRRRLQDRLEAALQRKLTLRRFRFIKRYDRGLLLLNLLFLMVIAFVPFPTSVLSESGNRTATIFYALTMTLAGLMLTAVWSHAARQNRLTDPDLDPRQRRRQFVALFLTVALFVTSIGLAFLSEGLARLSWLLVWPISRYGQGDY